MGCKNSVTVSVSADKAWQSLRDFHDMSWAPNVISKLEVVGEFSGTEVGAKRVLNGAIHETLIELDESARKIRYSIDDGPEAISKDNVQGYIGQVLLIPAGDNSTTVEWTSTWESQKDLDVAAFCNPIYLALLSDMATSLK